MDQLDLGVITRIKGLLLKCLHVFVTLTSFICSVLAMVRYVNSDFDWHRTEFLSHVYKHAFLYFSIWVSIIQIAYFNTYFVLDAIEIFGKQSPSLQNIRNKLHAIASYMLFALVFPLSLMVPVIFWTIFLWNREIIFPEILDEIFPPFLNHTMHSWPPLFVFIYMFTGNEPEPPMRLTLPGLLSFLLFYGGILGVVKARSGKWLYYFLDHLAPAQLNFFFLLVIFGTIAFFFLGYYLNSRMRVLREKVNGAYKKHV